MIVAILDEVADDVAAAFARQPLDITHYEALARAHLETFGSEQYGTSTSFERMRLLLTIVNSAPAIGLAPFMFRADGFHHGAVEVAAQRMGGVRRTPVDSHPLRHLGGGDGGWPVTGSVPPAVRRSSRTSSATESSRCTRFSPNFGRRRRPRAKPPAGVSAE